MSIHAVAHHLWGHIFNGSTDPRYISTMTWYTTATDGAGLMDATETRDYSVLRFSVIISVNRQVVKLFSNLAPSTDDSRANVSMQPVSCADCQALQRRLRDLKVENEPRIIAIGMVKHLLGQ